MSRISTIFSYVQIMVIVCLIVCNGGIAINSFKKSGELSCKGHQCGCRSESDCKAHCCCGPYESHNLQNNSEKQKNSFQVFISSINCKFGNDPVTGITFMAKYILESNVQPVKESFLCFLFYDISIHLPEVFVSPPEKPPRSFI